MIPGAFDYHRPSSVADAALLFRQLGEDARLLAGGHSLIPLMKTRLATPDHLIDLSGVGGLKGVRRSGGVFVLGAMTTEHELIQSEQLAEAVPILREAARRSPIRRCAIAARLAATSPMAIPATTCPP
jgi:aerobic carbon-monoxide dehydrogenase medium subunit